MPSAALGSTFPRQVATPAETVELLREIEEVFTRSAAHLIYHHKASCSWFGCSIVLLAAGRVPSRPTSFPRTCPA